MARNDDKQDETIQSGEDYEREMRYGRSGLQHHGTNGSDFDREHYGANANLGHEIRKDEHRYDDSTERSGGHPTTRPSGK